MIAPTLLAVLIGGPGQPAWDEPPILIEPQHLVGSSEHELDDSLRTPFLLGDAPSIADFSIYHCLWFLEQNETNAALLAPFTSVGAWMARMAALGHGAFEDASGWNARAPEFDAGAPA